MDPTVIKLTTDLTENKRSIRITHIISAKLLGISGCLIWYTIKHKWYRKS